MILRLFLLSFVAGLGVSVPGQRDLETLSHSAQRWVNAHLANWDSRAGSGEGIFIYVAEAPGTPRETDRPVAPPQATIVGDDQAALDLAFRSIVEEMAPTFAVELAAMASASRTEADRETMAVELAPVATTSVQSEPTGRVASPEPLEVGEDLYPGEAYALNRLSEGIGQETPVAFVEPASPRDRLTNAVRLTREAIFAWTSLLHGPAMVTATR